PRRIASADPATPVSRLAIVLPLRDAAGLEKLLARQLDPRSTEFRRWLTPAQFGERFGARERDIAFLTEHFVSRDVEVSHVSAGRTLMLVSGRADDLGRALGTSLGEYVNESGGPALLWDAPPAVPLPGAKVVASAGRRHSLATRSPLYTDGTSHQLAPADFHRIYGVESLLASGVDGRGARIGILARTNVSLEDMRRFRTEFGLPEKPPTIVLNGPDPGVLGYGDRLEANLDVQWAGAVAPGADVDVVITKSTATSDGVDLSALYAVDANRQDILSMSFGTCEEEFVGSDTELYTNVWAQAAAQGISVFVASGDSGAAGCDSPNASMGTKAGVNGLSTSPYATCVGGTQFDDGGQPERYWEATNDTLTKRSVLGPIPERVWNESALAGGRGLIGTGGGTSVLFSRPSWQTGPGLPAGDRRMVPDAALNASGKVPYIVVLDSNSAFNGFTGVTGTSASAPAFAGIAALLVQRAGGRIGNLNPALYRLGTAQFDQGSPVVFRDVTTGDNGVPGVPGFAAGPGWDASTGWGSPIVDGLVGEDVAAATPLSPSAFLAVSPAIVKLDAGGSATVTVLLRSASKAISGSPAPLTLLGLPAGVTARFSPAKPGAETAGGLLSEGTALTVTLTAAPDAPGSASSVEVVATRDGREVRATLFLGVARAADTTGAGIQVPVVLEAAGAGGAFFTSDLVLGNATSATRTALLRFVPTAGGKAADVPVVGLSVPSGRQIVFSEAISFLRETGAKLGAGGAIVGTLFVSFPGSTSTGGLFAGSRVSTPNPNTRVGGRFGTFAPGVPPAPAVAESWVFGLREDAAFRSNLGLVHGAFEGSALELEVQVFDGETGAAAGDAERVTLTPGEFRQLNRVLTLGGSGVTNGYVRVRRISGTAPTVVYGVVNDGAASGGGTSDGSFVPSGGVTTEGLVPIVLDVPAASRFRTELVLANPTAEARVVSLRYASSPAFGARTSGTATATLAPGRQLVIADAIAFLRSNGVPIPSGAAVGGTLAVSGA
ncbi:MAG: S53 family peptidase, partial [Acidobacteria bacterium]|nr:S53 family peptidase [Acidobacteriota bacterium]